VNLTSLDLWAAAAPSGRLGGLCHSQDAQNALYHSGSFGWFGLDAVDFCEPILDLDHADCIFKRQPLASDVTIIEWRVQAVQLVDQRRARTIVERAAGLGGIPIETRDGGREQLIVGLLHCDIQ